MVQKMDLELSLNLVHLMCFHSIGPFFVKKNPLETCMKNFQNNSYGHPLKIIYAIEKIIK